MAQPCGRHSRAGIRVSAGPGGIVGLGRPGLRRSGRRCDESGFRGGSDRGSGRRRHRLRCRPSGRSPSTSAAWGGHRRCSHTKGALVHKLIKAGCALFSAHTNADSADPPGVSDALAQALGLTVLRPIEPKPTQPLDKWVVMVPVENASAVQDALFEAGAGRIGDYSQCSWTVTGTGQFLPADGANPTIGTVALWSRFARIVWK